MKKVGWVLSIDDNLVTCRLQKDFELDEMLEFSKIYLTTEQNNLLGLGSVMRYDKKSYQIDFMTEEGNWI